MPAKIERKVLKLGDSKVIAIPPDWARMFRIEKGDDIDVIYNAIVILKPPHLQLDLEFLKKELEIICDLEKIKKREKE